MPVTICDNKPQLVYPAALGPGLIVNTDTVNPVYLGSYGTGINTLSDQIPAQGSVAVDGSRDVYASTLNQAISVKLQAMAGATQWANPVGVQVALNALGLAKETTQQQVLAGVGDTVTTLGSPAQDGTVQAVHTVLGAPAQDGSVQAVHTVLGSPAQDGTVGGLPAGIASTGVPLLALSTIFSNPGAQTFTAGQKRQYGPGTFDQLSYEISLSLISNAAETNPYFKVELQWSDSVSGQLVADEIWYLAGSPGAPANIYSGVGRAKGDTLEVFITNLGTLASGSCQVVITRSSRVYVRDDFRSTTFNGQPGTTNATWDPNGGILLSVASNVGANGQIQRSMPLYCGTCRLEAFTQTAAANISIQSLGQAGGASLTNSTVFQAAIGANAFINQQFDLPRGQCVMIITNQGAAVQQIGAAVIVSEQNV